MASRLALRPLTRVRLTTRLTPTHIASRSIASKSAPALAAAAKQRGPSPKIASTPARGASTAAEIEAELAAEAAGENGARAAAVEIEPLDLPLGVNGPADTATDWSRSYHGLSTQPFPKEAADILLAPIDSRDVEMKPDGIIYLPEIKYRRILNRAFGPGGWGLAPRSETNVGPTVVSREYALVCLGRLVAIARGEQEYFDPSGIPTATEACKSNALMRCCKDLGIASELWDPRFIRDFKANYCVEVFAENVNNKRKKKLWRRKDQPKLEYPWKEQ